MGDIRTERPDLVEKGWTQEMWDARNGQSTWDKMWGTDDGFANDWKQGKTQWQQIRSQPGNEGINPYTGEPYVPTADVTRGLTAGSQRQVGAGGQEYFNRDTKPIGFGSPGSELQTTEADRERRNLAPLLGALQQQAATGSGGWEKTFADATQKASANAQALGLSQTGRDVQSQLRDIANAQGAVAQGAVGEGEMLRNQAKIDAQDRMAQLIGGLGSQDIGQSIEEARVKRGVQSAEDLRKEQERERDTAIAGGVGQAVTAVSGMSDGGRVPGAPKVFGDDERNDTVKARLSPGEIVIPRSITQGPNPIQGAAEFVRAIKSKEHGGFQNMAIGGNINIPSITDQIADQAPMSELDPEQTKFGGNKGEDIGATLDTSKYEGPGGTRDSARGLSEMLSARAVGAGPTVAPQLLQRSNDKFLADALRAQQMGKTPGGDVLQSAAQAGISGGVDAARQSAVEQSQGQLAQLGFGLGQRDRELQLAKAKQQAAWENTLREAGVDLRNQQFLMGMLGGLGQTYAGLAASAPGQKPTTAFDPMRYQADAAGERGGYTDLSYGQEKAHGGIIEDEEERKKSMEFVNSLRASA